MQVVRNLSVRDLLVGDLRDQTAVRQAVRGVRGVYHICPNVSPDEVAIGELLIAAAKSAGVEHFVFHSVFHPQIEAMPHHWGKLQVEQRLFESGLNFTILQPTTYMQNVLASWDQIVQQGIYEVPYSADTRLSMVDLEDVAQVAALVLTQGGHVGATYELVGVESISPAEVAATLSVQLNRPVRAEPVRIDTWEGQARTAGLGGEQVAMLVKMFRYYERHGFWGNSRVLSCLLGRPPTLFDTFVERMMAEGHRI
jgi:uncharacterized protein YbjT (DUF2867 family)